MLIFILITLAYTFYRGFHWVYLYQIKEYRLDRLISHIKEYGVLSTLYTSRTRRPSVSPRNGLLVAFLCVSCILLFLLALERQLLYISLIVLLPFSPALALLIITCGVFATEIPAKIFRSFSILKAVSKVRQSQATFIGITGTYGKTSVKEFIWFILSARFNVAKTDNNMNTGVGIAMGINNNLKKNTRFFVTEVGSYRAGETRQATWYIPFTHGVLTGLGNQHLALYGSRENLIKEETSLLATIPEKGSVYINQGIPQFDRHALSLKANCISYGFHQSDIRARIVSMHAEGTKALIRYKSYEFTIQTCLPGEHSIINLLPAIALAMDYGMKPREIVQRIAELRPIEGKLSIHTGKAKAIVINDAVNSNVEGFLAALSMLKRYPQKTKFIVSPGIIELGGEKRASYEKILHEIYSFHGKLFTIDPLFKKLDFKNEVMIFNDVLHLRDKIVPLMNKHTVVLLEGKLSEEIKKSFMH